MVKTAGGKAKTFQFRDPPQNIPIGCLGSGKSNKVLPWEKEATSMFFDEFS